MNGRLEGRVAIITGATSGIGEATARRFAAEGARVVLAGRTVAKGEVLARDLGPRAVFQRADVTREADIAALVDTALGSFGRLDCLFSNAGAPTGRRKEKREKGPAPPPPLPRPGRAADGATAALFPPSDESSFVTCHALVVDGGRSAFFFGRPREPQ